MLLVSLPGKGWWWRTGLVGWRNGEEVRVTGTGAGKGKEGDEDMSRSQIRKGLWLTVRRFGFISPELRVGAMCS